MSPALLSFQTYMATPELAHDFEIITATTAIQDYAIETGDDTPGGWFAQAAHAYPPCPDDPEGDLARRTCQLVAQALWEGVPS